jgi:hypothetical protein
LARREVVGDHHFEKSKSEKLFQRIDSGDAERFEVVNVQCGHGQIFQLGHGGMKSIA